MAQATPAQIARYGHIAALLRGLLEERKWKPPDVNNALGVKRDNTAVYMWLNAKSAPGPKIAAKLAKLLGVAPSELLARDLDVPERRDTLPARVAAQTRPPEVLRFNVDAAGMTRLHLDIELPIDRGVPLLRMLLDAGLVMGGE